MGHNWFLIGLAEGSLAASLGLPLAAILGYDPRADLVVGLALAFVPSMLLSPFASDFASKQDPTAIHPNIAARVLHVHEYIRSYAFCLAFCAIPLLPIGVLVGLRGRWLAAFMLGGSVLVAAAIEGLLAWFMRKKN